MTHSFKISVIVFLLISSTLCLTSCKKKDTISTLTTVSVSGITQTSAVSGGNVTSDGGAEVTARGVCWGISHNPIISSDKTDDGTGTGAFTSNLAGLTANITYYVRAYAINSQGTSYGNEVSFSTSQVTLATLTTTAITSITSITAVSGGNITTDGGGTITSRGVCWNTASGATTSNSKTTDGTGTGTFTSNLTGLTPNTTYYVRAYATNSVGTAYGNELTFTTSSTVPGAPSIGTATAGNAQATVTFTAPASNGGSTITGYTVTSSPGNITGTGSASPITVTGLTNGTAYTFTVTATNAIGTSLASSASNSVTPLLTDIDGNVYNIVTIGTQVWMAENLKTTKYNDGTPIPNTTDNTTWAALTTGAYSDYSNTPSNSTTYGRLYNWYVVDNNAATKVASNGGKNVCPTSWHIPTDAEWTTLTTYLGGESVAGGKLKDTTHWTTPNIGATNETGFTALPGGGRDTNGAFYNIGNNGYWWSSSEGSTTYALSRYMYYGTTNVSRYNDFMQYGFSVRCVRD
jgi:uncharacterized protein (TIGR02145 family)